MKWIDIVHHVTSHADHVTVNESALDRYVADFRPISLDHWMKACPFEYRPLPRVEDEVARWFLSDAMAFCFWGYPAKWTTEYQGEKIDGWWGLLAAVQRALESGIPFTDSKYLANLTRTDAQRLFMGVPEIPLFDERVAALRQIGSVLINDYAGHVHSFLAKAPREATRLTLALASTFSTFNDTSPYKGETIPFYKKAQLLVHDLSVGFSDTPYGAITGVDDLIGEADYKIPWQLHKLGILIYDEELSHMINARAPLPVDSAWEVEIRAGMLWAIHLIVEKLQERGVHTNAMTVDGILWVQSQKKTARDEPYHLTLTTDY